VRRPTIPALVIAVGVLVLADFLVVNRSLGDVAGLVIDAAIVVAAGAALALRRASDLWRRRGEPIGAGLVLVGMAAVLIAGLRPGANGASDPAVGWIVSALMLPIGATLFGLLFVTTLSAARRSADTGGREALVLVGSAVILLILLVPIGGTLGDALAAAADWALEVPIGAVFRGILIGVAVLVAVFGARTLLGIGSADD
jgi:Na+-transporting NADH:ubiquinone oxidoreductase subunit NqrB